MTNQLQIQLFQEIKEIYTPKTPERRAQREAIKSSSHKIIRIYHRRGLLFHLEAEDLDQQAVTLLLEGQKKWLKRKTCPLFSVIIKNMYDAAYAAKRNKVRTKPILRKLPSDYHPRFIRFVDEQLYPTAIDLIIYEDEWLKKVPELPKIISMLREGYRVNEISAILGVPFRKISYFLDRIKIKLSGGK